MNSHNHQHDSHEDHFHDHGHTLIGELVHHIPYAIFSVAFSLIVLSFIGFISQGFLDPKTAQKGAKMLFHSFHFMHIVFAATGTIITFRRFSKNTFNAILVGILSPTIFCTLSDSILPYLGGTALGVSMSFHLCFFSELSNVIPFLIVGIINGLIMSGHNASKQLSYSVFSHFIHIFVSSLASSFYLVAHGFTQWHKQIGFVFLFLIFAVVIPCTLSDVVVPMWLAKVRKKNEKH
jgi:hypothetical protein